MNTILFSSIAAAGLLLASTAASAGDSRSIDGHDGNSGHPRIVSHGNGHHDQPDYGPALRTDAQAYDWGDEGNVAFAAPDGSSYSYDGEWDGEFVDPQGRVFEGEWQGTVTRHDGANLMSAPDASSQHYPHNDAPYPGGPNGAPMYDLDDEDDEVYERHELRHDSHDEGRYSSRRYQHAYPQTYQHGWQGGYYYYPTPMVTIVSGAPVTTTTVTEEIYYETIRTAPRKRAIRKWKPKPRPRCVC